MAPEPNRFTPPCRRASCSARANRAWPRAAPARSSADAAAKQGAVSRLVQIYANRGHLVANLDPLGLEKRERPRVLELGYFGLTDADLDTEFLTGSRPSELAPRAQAARNHRATRIRLLRHHRRRVRARVEHRRAPVAAGPVPARAACAASSTPTSRKTFSGSSRRPKASSVTCTPSTSARSASRSKAATR